MGYKIGQGVDLYGVYTDRDGNPITVGDATVKVRDPIGNIDTIAATETTDATLAAKLGVAADAPLYTAVYVTAKPGRHLYRFQSTVGATAAEEDDFWVDDSPFA